MVSYMAGAAVSRGVFQTENIMDSVDEIPTVGAILLNNLSFCLIASIGLGVVSVPLLIYQGFQMGVAFSIWIDCGNSISSYVALVMPHFIFEYPALLISASLGIVGVKQVLSYYNGESVDVRGILTRYAKWYLAVAVFLLIAAFVECHLTGNLFNLFFGAG